MQFKSSRFQSLIIVIIVSYHVILWFMYDLGKKLVKKHLIKLGTPLYKLYIVTFKPRFTLPSFKREIAFLKTRPLTLIISGPNILKVVLKGFAVVCGVSVFNQTCLIRAQNCLTEDFKL